MEVEKIETWGPRRQSCGDVTFSTFAGSAFAARVLPFATCGGGMPPEACETGSNACENGRKLEYMMITYIARVRKVVLQIQHLDSTLRS